MLSLCRGCLMWLVVGDAGDAGGGGRWRRSLSAHPARLRAASNENETKRSSVCFLFQRDGGGNEETQLSKGKRLAMEDKERSKAHEAVTQTAT